MNSKILITFFLLLLSACGLKKRPIPPANSGLPSISDKYKVTIERESLNKSSTSEEEEKKKKEVKE